MEYSEEVQHLYRQVLTNTEYMMLKPKYARPLDQTEDNVDTIVTESNDHKKHQIHGYTDCPTDQSLLQY